MARFILVLKGKRQDIVITRCSAAALSCDIGSEDGALFSSVLASPQQQQQMCKRCLTMLGMESEGFADQRSSFRWRHLVKHPLAIVSS